MFYRISRLLPVFLFYLCISATPAFAGSDAPYQALTDKFFENLSKDRYEEAFDQLYATNRHAKRDNPQQLSQYRSQFLTGKEVLGPYRGSVKLAERETAGVFVHQLYLVMFERRPIGMRFQYYKPEKTWMSHAFAYFGDLDGQLGARAEQEVMPPMLPQPPAKPSAVDFQIERERTLPTPLARNSGE